MEQPNMNFDLNNTSEIICEECNNNTFKPIFYLRKLSGLLAPDGNSRVIPLDTLACLKCGHVNSEFKPQVVKNAEMLKTESNKTNE